MDLPSWHQRISTVALVTVAMLGANTVVPDADFSLGPYGDVMGPYCNHGKCYTLHTRSLTYPLADNWCQTKDYGRRLVAIMTKEELDFIRCILLTAHIIDDIFTSGYSNFNNDFIWWDATMQVDETWLQTDKKWTNYRNSPMRAVLSYSSNFSKLRLVSSEDNFPSICEIEMDSQMDKSLITSCSLSTSTEEDKRFFCSQEKCYVANSKRLSAFDAAGRCKSEMEGLVSISTKEELNFIRCHLLRIPFDEDIMTSAWTRFTTSDVFWDNRGFKKVNETWLPIDKTLSTTDTVGLLNASTDFTTLRLASYKDPYPFICEKGNLHGTEPATECLLPSEDFFQTSTEPITDHIHSFCSPERCYILNTARHLHHNAVRWCQERSPVANSDLASIENGLELQFVGCVLHALIDNDIMAYAEDHTHGPYLAVFSASSNFTQQTVYYGDAFHPFLCEMENINKEQENTHSCPWHTEEYDTHSTTPDTPLTTEGLTTLSEITMPHVSVTNSSTTKEIDMATTVNLQSSSINGERLSTVLTTATITIDDHTINTDESSDGQFLNFTKSSVELSSLPSKTSESYTVNYTHIPNITVTTAAVTTEDFNTQAFKLTETSVAYFTNMTEPIESVLNTSNSQFLTSTESAKEYSLFTSDLTVTSNTFNSTDPSDAYYLTSPESPSLNSTTYSTAQFVNSTELSTAYTSLANKSSTETFINSIATNTQFSSTAVLEAYSSSSTDSPVAPPLNMSSTVTVEFSNESEMSANPTESFEQSSLRTAVTSSANIIEDPTLKPFSHSPVTPNPEELSNSTEIFNTNSFILNESSIEPFLSSPATSKDFYTNTTDSSNATNSSNVTDSSNATDSSTVITMHSTSNEAALVNTEEAYNTETPNSTIKSTALTMISTYSSDDQFITQAETFADNVSLKETPDPTTFNTVASNSLSTEVKETITRDDGQRPTHTFKSTTTSKPEGYHSSAIIFKKNVTTGSYPHLTTISALTSSWRCNSGSPAN